MLQAMLIISLLAMETSSGAAGAADCKLPPAIVIVDRFSDVPEAIRSDILQDGPVAEAGEPIGTDLISRPPLPPRGFVRGGHSGNRWFVWLEHGGFANHHDVIGYASSAQDAGDASFVRIANLQGEACVAINAFLAGTRSVSRSH